MERTKRLLVNDLDLKILIGDLQFNILNINYEPPIPLRYFTTHCHNSFELHFIPRGKGTLRISNTTYPIEPGTFYLTGPDVYHEQVADEENPMCEYCINFEFTILEKNSAKPIYPSSKELYQFKEILQSTNFWYGKDLYDTWNLLEKAMIELDRKILGYYATIQNLVSQVIINAIRNYSLDRAADYPFPEKLPLDMQRRIVDLFFRNCEKNLKPSSLAKILDVSVRQLERIMQRYYHMSFKEKLIIMRLEIAKDLLDNTSMTVEDISAKIGFSTSSYFCRIFKDKTGSTPSGYRRKL
jgi:AraC-like DNA-binding protein